MQVIDSDEPRKHYKRKYGRSKEKKTIRDERKRKRKEKGKE